MRSRILALSICVSSAAWAQGDPTAAEALFIAGRDAMNRGDFATACAKFAESDRLDPAAGTRINLADCEERRNHLAAAWRAWREALELIPPGDDRIPEVKKRAQALETRVPRLVLHLPKDQLQGTKITRDGIDVGTAALDLPLPVETGEHAIVVESEGRSPARFTVTLKEGELKDVPLSWGAPVAKIDHVEEKKSPVRTILTVSAFGLAGASALIGGITGGLAIGKKNDLANLCYPTGVCTQQGLDAASSGRALAVTSTITFIAAGVLAATGLVLIFTQPKKERTELGVEMRWKGVRKIALTITGVEVEL